MSPCRVEKATAVNIRRYTRFAWLVIDVGVNFSVAAKKICGALCLRWRACFCTDFEFLCIKRSCPLAHGTDYGHIGGRGRRYSCENKTKLHQVVMPHFLCTLAQRRFGTPLFRTRNSDMCISGRLDASNSGVTMTGLGFRESWRAWRYTQA